MINISELITDQDFCQVQGISITRSTTEVKNHVPVEVPTDIKVQGIITVASENEDSLLDDADLNSERIHIFTHKRLKTVGLDKLDGKTYSADIVHFNGADYIVRYCLDDAQYGFCRSTAVKLRQDVM